MFNRLGGVRKLITPRFAGDSTLNNMAVVIAQNIQKRTERINLNGEVIDPKTKKVIKPKEPEYVPPPQVLDAVKENKESALSDKIEKLIEDKINKLVEDKINKVLEKLL